MKELELNLTNSNAWVGLGVEGGGTVNGILYSPNECYVKALEADPKNSDARHNLGVEGISNGELSL
jgi:hypothetical protein